MFPLRDTIGSRSTPYISWLLIAANVVIFLFSYSLGARGFERFLQVFGLVPARLALASPLSLVTMFTSMFLHGGWLHLISNMWMLFIFGDNVEDRMGHTRFLVFYLLGGAAAGLVSAFFLAKSSLPMVGASGAIAAVMGAYLVLFPGARVVTFVPLFFLPWLIDIPAVIFLGVWFLTQLSSGILSIGAPTAFGAIAWWAHIGGFVYGVVLARNFSRSRWRTYLG